MKKILMTFGDSGMTMIYDMIVLDMTMRIELVLTVGMMVNDMTVLDMILTDYMTVTVRLVLCLNVSRNCTILNTWNFTLLKSYTVLRISRISTTPPDFFIHSRIFTKPFFEETSLKTTLEMPRNHETITLFCCYPCRYCCCCCLLAGTDLVLQKSKQMT